MKAVKSMMSGGLFGQVVNRKSHSYDGLSMEKERTGEGAMVFAGKSDLGSYKGELNHIPLFHNHSITSLILSCLKINLLRIHLLQKSQPM